MDVLEVIVETNQQALCQTDVFGRNDNTQCESTQHENDNCDSCTDKYCFRIILGGIFYILNVDTAHFHTGIKEEDTCGEYDVVEVRQIGEEAAVEVQIGVSACSQINDPQDNQQGCRDNGTNHTTDFGNFTYPSHTFQ